LDGGAISFRDQATYEKALLLRDFGINRANFRDSLGEISPASDISTPGFNAMMNEVNSYIGIQQLKQVDTLLGKQRENAKKWDAKAKEFNLRPLALRSETRPNFWVYSAFSNQIENDLIRIRDHGYYASKVHLRNDLYSCFGSGTDLKGVAKFASTQLSVPSGWWTNDL
jgi:dTDP-4-amino-4,6-dideoxygalactose transaminase